MYVGKDKDGKKIMKSFTAETKKESEYLAAEYLMTRKEKQQRGLTLAEAYEKYIDSKMNVLSPNTIREYRKASHRDLQELMPLYVSEITQEQIQLAINAHAATHSPKSVKNAHGLLSAVLRAYRPDFVLRTTLPPRAHYDRHIPSEADVKKLIEVTQGKRIQVPILLAAFGAMRRGEIAALTPADVTSKGVWIKKAIAVNEKGERVVKSPKSYAGYRFVEYPDWIIKRLKAWRFGMSIDSITNEFRKAVDAAGIAHVRFHDLRHYHASVAHALGIPDKYIMSRGGWSSLSVLHDVYQHTIEDKQKEFTQKALDESEAFNPDKKA